MYLAYTYYIVNKVTGQYYYGSRYKNISLKRTPAQDLWIYYQTSSNSVKQLIDEYGKDSFEVSIIMEDEDYDKCYMYEQQMISQHLGNDMCLNQYCRLTNKFSTVLSDEAKQKISVSKTGKQRKPFSDETIAKMRDVANNRKPMSVETKAKMSASKTGRTLLGSKTATEQVTTNKSAHNSGKPMTDEQKAKLSAAMKGRTISDEHKAKISAAMKGRVWSKE